MADYYQLIARAVSALPNNSPEARDAIYERARRALVKQLRILDPPVSEADIERETKLLEEAIAQLEIETALVSSIDAKKKPDEPKNTDTVASEPPPFSAQIATLKSEDAWLNPPEPNVQPVPQPPAEDEAETSARAEDAVEDSKPKDTARPAAPSVDQDKKSSTRLLILAAVACLVVASVAGTALWLKQNPDDPARKPRIDASASIEAKPEQGKISERADAPPPPVTTITPAKPAGAAIDKPAETIPVAIRSALLIEAPEEPAKVKTYIGTVVWSTSTKTTTNGTLTIMHGDVVIGDADVKFGFNLQKNDDPNFPADILMDLRFNGGPQSQIKSIKDMSMPEMRQEETARGEPLKGGIVAITSTDYMAGLSRVDREKTRNNDLLTQRGWFDVPMSLPDGRAAKLTIEKGIAGARALAEVMK